MLTTIQRLLPDRAVAYLARLSGRSPRAARLMVTTARRLAPRQRVSAIAIVRDQSGRLLVARHAFRSGLWALPGGWVHRDEDPGATVVREVWEELALRVEPVAVVACETHATGPRHRVSFRPSALSVVYLCTPVAGEPTAFQRSPELSDAEWVDVAEALVRLSAFERHAIREALMRSPA